MSNTEKATDIAMLENAEEPPIEDRLNHESLDDEELEEYALTWRTGIAVLALSLVFGATTYSISGPNFAITNMVETFPNEAKDASWIASAGLLCAVTIPNVVGTTSDRFGKKRYLIAGCLLGVIGASVCGSAANLKIIIGGQALTGLGGSLVIVAVPAAMEVVPAKYRPLVFGLMSISSGILGAVGGPFIFAACIQNSVGGTDGWRFGFYFQAIIFGAAFVGIILGYSPPPTRFQREQSSKELLRSLDYVGIPLVSLAFAFIVVALIWGGQTYPWKSAQVISLLIIGPLLLIMFGIYEWKGRTDGILNHGFFESRNFPILLWLGAVDGMLLYGMSQFAPNEVRAIYTTIPIDAARIIAYNGGFLCVGYIAIGVLVTKLKRFKVALIVANVLTTIFVGLMARATPYNQGYFEGMIAAVGFLTAANTVIPVGIIALVVPSHLLATSNLILSSVRVIGGLLGITIFSIVYNNKVAALIPQAVLPILTEAGVPTQFIPQILSVLLRSPQTLAQVPNISPSLFNQIILVTAEASAESYKFVWYCIVAVSGACTVATLFLLEVPERMTNQVETILEHRDHRKNKLAIEVPQALEVSISGV